MLVSEASTAWGKNGGKADDAGGGAECELGRARERQAFARELPDGRDCSGLAADARPIAGTGPASVRSTTT